MGEPLCPKCGMEPIPGCDGRGHIPVGTDGTTMRLCRRLYAKALQQHLGREISRVQHVPSSPLLRRGPDGKPTTNRTKDNLRIMGCTWGGLLPHLKLALASGGLNFDFLVITDQQIKNVYVGNEQFKSKSLDRRMAEESFNSLGDLVGQEHHLVIIRLGFIGHKNVAAAGALKEALLIREALDLPTWVVEDPDRPWNYSCDADVENYIDERFARLTIKGADPGVPVEEEKDVDIGVDDESEEEYMPVIQEPSAEPNGQFDDDLELPGEDQSRDSWSGSNEGCTDDLELPGENSRRGRR